MLIRKLSDIICKLGNSSHTEHLFNQKLIFLTHFPDFKLIGQQQQIQKLLFVFGDFYYLHFLFILVDLKS